MSAAVVMLAGLTSAEARKFERARANVVADKELALAILGALVAFKFSKRLGSSHGKDKNLPKI